MIVELVISLLSIYFSIRGVFADAGAAGGSSGSGVGEGGLFGPSDGPEVIQCNRKLLTLTV